MTRQVNTLPETAKKYGESPIFTAQSVPKRLLAAHDLKPGTWGRLSVFSGEVQFFFPERSEAQAVLAAGDVHIISPVMPHFIRVSDDARFQIEFLREG